jgi:diguanylate cyclase (GGDEF)-like protein
MSGADLQLLESWARFASLALERRCLYEQLSFRAKYDDLTKLLNRASLYESLEAQIFAARHENDALAVLYFDLDFFKDINDRCGHAAGDAVLRHAARRILESIRCSDVAARIGGDEFVVLLPGVNSRGDAERTAELIGKAVSESIHVDGVELRVRPSTGIALFPTDGQYADALLKVADEDMYRTKIGRRSASLRKIS